MKESLPILFSTRMTPEEIAERLPKDKEIFVRMYHDRNMSTMYFNNGFKPHAIIKNIMFDADEGWFGFVEIPPEYVKNFKMYINPVIHPCVTGTDGNYQFRFFEIFDKNGLLTNNVYNGIRR